MFQIRTRADTDVKTKIGAIFGTPIAKELISFEIGDQVSNSTSLVLQQNKLVLVLSWQIFSGYLGSRTNPLLPTKK
jgi:hypothetical protein